MKPTDNQEYEYVYVKRPLSIDVPAMGDMQARKNPFSKALNLGTFVKGTSKVRPA